MRRRLVLGLPALAGVALGVAACGGDVPGPTGQDGGVTGPGSAGAADAERVAYGDDPSQYAELFLPSGTPRGVVVVVHGGFWRAEYDASLGQPLARSLADEGWAAWNLEYRRLGNGGGAPETFDDVAAGIDALRDLDAGQLGGLDPAAAPVVTLGHSAGGHLAAWAAGRLRFAEWAGGLPVTAVVSQAGVLDLRASEAAGLGGGAAAALLGHVPTEADARYDPALQVPLDVPVWCVHGIDDTTVPIAQSEDYVTAALAAGAQADLVAVPGDHFVVIDVESDAWTRTLAVLDGLR